MADNVAITAGTGTTIATDEVTINATTVQAQRMKLILGKDGTYTADAAGRDAGGGDGALYVDRRLKLIRTQVTPTVSTSPAYTIGDCLGGLQTISNAVRTSGGSCRLVGLQILDKSQANRPAIDLYFFDRSVTVAGDNAAIAMSDADMANCIGFLRIAAGSQSGTNPWNTTFPGTPLNSVAVLPNQGHTTTGLLLPNPLPMDFVLNGTDLFVQAVTQTAITAASTTDFVFSYVIQQD